MIETRVRPLTLFDIPFCTHSHLQAFQGFFLTFMGADFLRELYSAIVCDPSGIGSVAELLDTDTGQQRGIRGFVVGSAQPAGLYARLLHKRLLWFAWASLSGFVKKPAILPRLLRAIAMPGQKMALPNCATLMSIAVLPETQGQGIGQKLVLAFLAEARGRGLEHVNLTTDRLNNDSANRFYRRLGFSLLRSYTTPEGRQMNEYAIALCPEAEQQVWEYDTVPAISVKHDVSRI